MRSILNAKIESPVGRKMILISPDVKSEESQKKFNLLLKQQKYILLNERTTTSEQLHNIFNKVTKLDGGVRTIQQVIVGLKDEEGQ